MKDNGTTSKEGVVRVKVNYKEQERKLSPRTSGHVKHAVFSSFFF